ncbi:MAG: hypothetical protein ABIP79_00250 [Chitinophagaceae bacterium]
MSSLIISPKNKKELNLVMELLDKMNIRNKLLTESEKEDIGLTMLMDKANRTKKVSRDVIMKKLK